MLHANIFTPKILMTPIQKKKKIYTNLKKIHYHETKITKNPKLYKYKIISLTYFPLPNLPTI